MSGASWVFNEDQMTAALLRHVNEGAPELRSDRVRDVDGIRNFMFSDAAAKLRVTQPPKESP